MTNNNSVIIVIMNNLVLSFLVGLVDLQSTRIEYIWDSNNRAMKERNMHSFVGLKQLLWKENLWKLCINFNAILSIYVERKFQIVIMGCNFCSFKYLYHRLPLSLEKQILLLEKPFKKLKFMVIVTLCTYFWFIKSF